MDCYIKQLDELSKHKNDNFCMLGIFAPWGRGKTYFYHKLKEKLLSRDNSNSTDKCKFKFVDFNVWKYQDTPAIWAYLYEILYNKLTCCQQLKLYFKNLIHWKTLIPYVVAFLVLGIAFCFLIGFGNFIDTIIGFCKQYILVLFPVFLIISFIGIYLKNPFKLWSYIAKKVRRKSYQNYLGLQNDLEKDVESLIKVMISSPNEKQLILYVDDIDRCASSKMMEVINSLRIILENTEIQKRMIVLCSIDADKLIEGYCITKKTEDCNSLLIDLKEDARSHIDKLFIFSIGLPKLDILQESEYLRMLTQNKLKSIELEQFIQRQPYSTNRVVGSLVVSQEEVLIEDFTDDKIYNVIVEFLQRKKIVGLPPRKLRIMYYRILFANNIIASGNAQITLNVIENILNKSLYNYYKINDDEVFSDVVNMVVPY